MLTFEISIWLWCVHAELERVEDTQVTGARSSADAGLGIVDQQSVLLGQERHLSLWCLVCVPYDRRLGGRLVDSNSVGSLVGGAGGQDIDGRGRLGQRGVVPGEGDKVADLVELGAGEGAGRDHGDAACGEAVVVASGLGLAGGLAARGFLGAADAGLLGGRSVVVLVAVGGTGLARLGRRCACGLVARLLLL